MSTLPGIDHLSHEEICTLAHLVCIPNCREGFDGKHAAWCPGRLVTDYIRDLAAERASDGKEAGER